MILGNIYQKEDFEKIKPEEIEDIYSQVSMPII